ncbi:MULTISPECIES: amylo-alpha-1,6-glucosidase [unclassified Enterococcus]|uniref:GH36-type glycosyl hydrolase domain-containing protein n=1 Tax=unclassified Enterococcus TaxID=2608891 RepID=UPI00155656F0|nr:MULTISPECIES: amylo-alpha-1,6-glucosidase [unclassified Enterococcus]MBS7578435.1 cellobiose phosphorylase [Enterococcus sp. MMGLQ5-2]MBS7585666.1 cellobiose phosphorylase [Enterococcus sp. MMGLQ5-1]NPD13525.1 cellobiose phosphorylase [Enterococcus sp. MMGLQ5-1]NPD38267.1 cellobiose phosphorylase [Enterococcus sp. MMGLQ5-2]
MKNKRLVWNKAGTSITFLDSGDLYEIKKNDIMINQLNGNFLDGSCNQIYLRIFDKEKIEFIPLIGSNSQSDFYIGEEQLTWQGKFRGVAYQVSFKLAETGIWFWQVQLNGSDQKVDLIYGQDIGNAQKAAVQANEAYMSQYVDHHVTKIEDQIVISSRQNQVQNGNFPLLEQGSLNSLVAYSTDGYQFFGTSYKATNQPEVLTKRYLANEVYQYEFAYTALQTTDFTLSSEPKTIVFYGVAIENQAQAVESIIVPRQVIENSYQNLNFEIARGSGRQFEKSIGQPVIGESFTDSEIEALFPNRKQVEKRDDHLLSFFTPEYHHVVLKEKEVMMERAHGHILLSGTDLTVDQPLMSTTLYMYGIFNSQVVLGNTSMNKLMSNSRNALNLVKQSGQRIYLKEGEAWRILTMPSAFEMGLNSAVWYYKLADDLLIVETFAIADGREFQTKVTSQNDKAYCFLITNQLLMGDNEESVELMLQQKADYLVINSAPASAVHQAYPSLTYYMAIDKPFKLADESILVSEHESVLTTMLIENQSDFTITIQGSLTGEPFTNNQTTLECQDQAYTQFLDCLLNHFTLTHETQAVDNMNVLTRWYTHNMLVHYLSPHGLEQYGGAAWGTRDVSQGPTEFFLAVNRPEIVASIIENVFANQFEDDGNWPQWFMFDRYEKQKADESHGDVIVWPMKIVADYLAKTQDFSILEMKIPYTNRETFLKTQEVYSLFDHLKKEIAYIEANFLEGTYLSCYGDGDWDDTLQPYDSKLKKHMASSWTVALTYQVLNKLGGLLKTISDEYGEHLLDLSGHIKRDFKKYMLGTETIPGFVYMEDNHQPELMIHPSDQKTGIQYRLLPMTRSMIAEILTPEQAQHHLDIINNNLKFPDGVRLMNRPANYHGGVSTNFKRAEQAANFGREVGLQYVHAHIRYTEAMAKLGKGNETWQALNTINPVLLQDRLNNAEIRQSNTYFSSSDGAFKTRYEAQEKFGTLKDGSTKVKGGWRIYSSGPGIYLNQLLTNVLGIRESAAQIVFDPVLPADLDGLQITYQVFNQDTNITYHLNSNAPQVLVNGQSVAFENEANAYRRGGLIVQREALEKILKENNQIDVYC